MQEVLINILIFCGIILLIVFMGMLLQFIIIMIDIRHAVKTVKKKVETFTSVIDIASLLLGGLEGIKSRVLPRKKNISALLAGIKRALEVIFNKKV